MLENVNTKAAAKRYYRKKIDLFALLNKMKLWPSRTGVLHGIREIQRLGENLATVVTHCGCSFKVRNSRRSRAARWLRNKLYQSSCGACAVPQWKLNKYGSTFFSRNHGSLLHGEADITEALTPAKGNTKKTRRKNS